MEKELNENNEQENDVTLPSEETVQLPAAEHQKLLDDVASYKDKYVRLVAEFDNARKRMDRERTEFIKYASEDVITDFLGILDNLELSVNAAKTKHEDSEAFLKGMEMVLAHTHDMLKKHGIKPLDAKGKKFDPNCHEVLMQEESNDVDEGVVLEELQKGYTLKDKVIRTSKVKLAKKK